MSQAEVHRTLIGARAVLASRGLAKGVLGGLDLGDPVCIRGALNEAATGSPTLWMNDELRKACEQAMGFTGMMLHLNDPNSAVIFNNAPERTLEEVLDRLDQAIEATKPQDAIYVPQEWQKETVNV